MSLTLREILERPTIRALGELVARSRGTVETSASRIMRQPRTVQIIT
jgi:hypothetical protein